MPDLKNKISMTLNDQQQKKLEMMKEYYSNSKSIVQQLSPFVYWAQTEKQITLKIELKDAKVRKMHYLHLMLKFILIFSLSAYK